MVIGRGRGREERVAGGMRRDDLRIYLSLSFCYMLYTHRDLISMNFQWQKVTSEGSSTTAGGPISHKGELCFLVCTPSRPSMRRILRVTESLFLKFGWTWRSVIILGGSF